YAAPTRNQDGEGGEWAVPVVPVSTTGLVDGTATQVMVRRLYRQRIDEPMRRVSLSDGTVLDITRAHKLLTPTGWTHSLKVGDHVAVPSRIDWHGLQVSEQVARF